MYSDRNFPHTGRVMVAVIAVAMAGIVAVPQTTEAQAFPQAGTVLELNEPFVFEPRQMRVTIQHGRTTRRANQNEPHCVLRVAASATDEQTVLPGEATITNRRTTTRTQIRPTAYYTTELSLESEENPILESLTCMALREPSETHLTIADIRDIVGDLLTLP